MRTTSNMCLLLPCRWSGTINGPRASRPCAYRAAAAPWPAAGWPPIQNRPACFFRPPHRMRPDSGGQPTNPGGRARCRPPRHRGQVAAPRRRPEGEDTVRSHRRGLKLPALGNGHGLAAARAETTRPRMSLAAQEAADRRSPRQRGNRGRGPRREAVERGVPPCAGLAGSRQPIQSNRGALGFKIRIG